MRFRSWYLVGLVGCVFVLVAPALLAAAATDTWPRRVLITNDDGIDDPGIRALATAFAEVTETWVVAAMQDRSGTSNFMSVRADNPTCEMEQRDLGAGITAYALDGYPADCVLVAARGLMQDNPPDLVISGINGGPTLRADGFGSRTVGAARTAALGGLPAIAVSGYNSDFPESLAVTARWVVALAQSQLVQNLRPGQYLTVSVPRQPADEILGIQVVDRAPLVQMNLPTLELMQAATDGGVGTDTEVRKHLPTYYGDALLVGDVAAFSENYLAVVPMNVDEVDDGLLWRLRRQPDALPSWPLASATKEQGMTELETNEYLYRIQSTRPELLTDGPTPDEAGALEGHFAYLQDLTDRGVVLLAGRTLNTDPSNFGIVIFRAESAAAAQEIMTNDPAVAGGVMTAELFPYRVALLGKNLD